MGRYALRYRIASGGMGAVYLASTEGPAGFGKWFAVKLMHAHLTDTRELVARFRDEARLACRIDHPNVCTVVDFGQEADGALYLVLEYLHGEPLSAILSRRPAPPWWLSCHVVLDAARGLHAAHELRDGGGASLGLVHRDVSPQNLFVLYEGPCKVLDFGVARVRDQIATTHEGQLPGKVAYMSPEQIEGLPLDRRADVWALGVVLWEALSGRRLFKRDQTMDTARAVLTAPIPHASDEAGVPPALDEIIERALARRMEDRFRNAADFADALARLLHGSNARTDQARVAKWMRAAFAEEIAHKDATLRAPPPAPVTVPELLAPFDGGSDPTRAEPPAGPGAAATTAFADPDDGDTHASSPTAPRTRARGFRGLSAGARWTLGVVTAAAVSGAFVVAGLAYVVGRLDAAPASPQVSSRAHPAEATGVPLPSRSRVDLVTRAPERAATPNSNEGSAFDAESTPGETDEEPTGPAPEAPAGDTDVATSRRAAPGVLNLIAFPEATVVWRGRRLGRTPLSTELPPGRHVLRLETDDGRTDSVTVVIRSRERTARTHRIGS